MLRFTRFSRSKIWFDNIGLCKRFDILQLCHHPYPSMGIFGRFTSFYAHLISPVLTKSPHFSVFWFGKRPLLESFKSTHYVEAIHYTHEGRWVGCWVGRDFIFFMLIQRYMGPAAKSVPTSINGAHKKHFRNLESGFFKFS